ncbi:MAG: DUF721 domain-containing protein [Desulfobacterota bacterium]|nr:DUF721 domain-containing protein [Thermodesulfobacteriota bacterium]
MKKPLPIGLVLKETLKGLELDGPMKRYTLWGAWKEIVGESISQHAQPQTIRDRTLFIAVSHSTWMQQLQFLKPTLLKKINEFLGEELIEDLRFRLGKISSTPAARPSNQQGRGKGRLRKDRIDRIDELLQNLKDPELKRGLRELLTRSALLEQSRKGPFKEPQGS